MTFLVIFYSVGLAILCRIPCRCIECQERIRSLLCDYSVFVTDAQKTTGIEIFNPARAYSNYRLGT